MNDMLVRTVAERFDQFTAPFLNAPGDAFAYRLKVDHTMRVLAVAEDIVDAERLPGHLVLASRLAALMHDVGRFPQYRDHRTFRDAVSANHAWLSVRHALRQKLLVGAPPEILRLVLGAVYLHNKRTLPPLPSKDLDTVARVVRDSDKLDIYQVMIDHFSQENPKHPEVAMDVKDEPLAYTRHVAEGLLRREPGDYRDIVYVNDFKLMVIGWLYDLNFRSSCRLLHEKGYVETLFATLPKDPLLDCVRQHVRADLAERLSGA
jgi:HD domain.